MSKNQAPTDKIRRGRRRAELADRLKLYETKAVEASRKGNFTEVQFWKLLSKTATNMIKIALQQLADAKARGRRAGQVAAALVAFVIVVLVAIFMVTFRIFDLQTFEGLLTSDFGKTGGNLIGVVSLVILFFVLWIGGFQAIVRLFIRAGAAAGEKVAGKVHDLGKTVNDLKSMPTKFPGPKRDAGGSS